MIITAPAARALSFLVGFFSLSSEILWMRLLGFAYHSQPQAFAAVLSAFLVGVAAGSWYGRIVIDRRQDMVAVMAWTLALAGACDLGLPFLASYTLDGSMGPSLPLVAVALSAALKAISFPILHELGTAAATSRVGQSFSYVYFSNIAGSTLGPLFTSYVLLDLFGTQQAFLLIAFGLLLLAAGILLRLRLRVEALLMAATALLLAQGLLERPERLHSTVALLNPGERLESLHENRHGVIHRAKRTDGLIAIYGGNVYDGAVNSHLSVRGNRIERAYYATVVHANPKKALMIGLSSGSWLSVLNLRRSLESIDVVEINPKYAELPGQSNALQSPRVRLHIDDGRRWLRHSPEKFDVVIMNTSYHWRNLATGVLSAEFLTLVKSRLNPGGVIFYNATSSPDVLKTASLNFTYAALFQNFVIASDSPLDRSENELLARLHELDLSETDRNAMSKDSSLAHLITREKLKYIYDVMKPSNRELLEITDDNMATEYRYPIFHH